MLLLCACVTARPASGPARISRATLQTGIVRVLVEGQSHDYTSPWSKHRPWSRKVNGLVVPGRGILVAGNTLANHTLLEVQKFGQAKIFSAQIKIVDYEVPLTLLTVKEDAFWEGLNPLPLTPELPTEGEVTIARWLSSGQLEVGQGRLQQVSVHNHWPAGTELLSLDVNTTIDAAGWSEVVLYGGAVVGLSTSMSKNRMIAMGSTVLRSFLQQAESGDYKGFASQGFYWQSLNNRGTRRHLGLQAGQGGVMVRKVMPKGSVAGALEPGDLVLKIDGAAINSAGKFAHPKYGRLFFGALFTSEHKPGETIPIEIIRKGKRQTVTATLRRLAPEEDQIPGYRYDKPPEYLIRGGLVFQELTRPFLQTWRNWWKNAPLQMLVAYEDRHWPTKAQPRLVVLSKVLPDPVNLGYQELGPMIIARVNGKPITSIRALEQAFQAPQGGFHIIDLQPGQGPYRIVLDAQAASEAEARIRRNYGIR